MNITKLLNRRSLIDRWLLKLLCHLQGSELPPVEQIGQNVKFPHGLKGIVIHPSTVIESNVTRFHHVTLGRGDLYGLDPRIKESEFKGIILKSGAIICCGAKVICNKGRLVVGNNTVVGANAVLLNSTNEDEIWGGVPAKLLKNRLFV